MCARMVIEKGSMEMIYIERRTKLQSLLATLPTLSFNVGFCQLYSSLYNILIGS